MTTAPALVGTGSVPSEAALLRNVEADLHVYDLPPNHRFLYRYEMRRLTPRYKKWLESRQRRELHQRRRRRIHPTGHLPTPRLNRPIIRTNARTVLSAPDTLSFAHDRDKATTFFGDVRAAVDRSLRKHTNLVVDLSALKVLRPAAALCLLAEFDRWQRLLRSGPLAPLTINSWDREIVRNLSDMGFFRLLNTRVPDHLKEGGPDAARYIRFVTGKLAEAEKQAQFRRLVGPPLAVQSDLTMGLYRSLGEAIANVVEHAYARRTYDYLVGPRWWLTGVVDEAQKRLRVVILDHGISIPASLAYSENGPSILRLLENLWPGREDDGSKIEAAMAYGRSRLGLPGRGKGLGDVLALTTLDRQNRLRVISRKGSYTYDESGSKSDTLECALNGTLVEWDLTLPTLAA